MIIKSHQLMAIQALNQGRLFSKQEIKMASKNDGQARMKMSDVVEGIERQAFAHAVGATPRWLGLDVAADERDKLHAEAIKAAEDWVFAEYLSTRSIGRGGPNLSEGVSKAEGRARNAISALAAAAVQACHFPQRDQSRPAEQQGVFQKFEVRRTDGSSAPGGKHHGCHYFVLDVDHDALAKPALQAYAAACSTTHPDLSADMVKRFDLAPVPPVAVPDGWKLVPIEPTDAMILGPGARRTDGKVARIHRDVWKRMMEAAPAAPAAQGDAEPEALLYAALNTQVVDSDTGADFCLGEKDGES